MRRPVAWPLRSAATFAVGARFDDRFAAYPEANEIAEAFAPGLWWPHLLGERAQAVFDAFRNLRKVGFVEANLVLR